MLFLVRRKLPSLSKSFAATVDGTNVRLLTGVRMHMIMQVLLQYESFEADFTLETADVKVHLQVHLQTVLSSETLFANITLE